MGNKAETGKKEKTDNVTRREGYPPQEECALCGGRCCREHGCCLSAEDFLRICPDPTEESVYKLLSAEGGLYAIEFFSAKDGPLYYLRMRHKCYTFIGADAMGECVALTPSGCSLSFDERPYGGKMLKSCADYHCTQMYGKEEMIKDWRPFSPILGKIWEKWYAVFLKDGTFDRCDENYFAYQRQNAERRKQQSRGGFD